MKWFMSLCLLTENEKGYLPAESSFPRVFAGNPGGIRMDPPIKAFGVTVLKLIFKRDAKDTNIFRRARSAHLFQAQYRARES